MKGIVCIAYIVIVSMIGIHENEAGNYINDIYEVGTYEEIECEEIECEEIESEEIESEEANYEDCSEENDYEEAINEVLQTIDFSEMDMVMQEIDGMESLSFEELIQSLIAGDTLVNWDTIRSVGYVIFLSELDSNRIVIMKLILLAIVTALFTSVSTTTGQGIVSENGFYISYLVMTALLISAFSIIYDLAEDTIQEMLKVMNSLVPTYMVAVGISSGATSSVALQEVLVLGIDVIANSVDRTIMPGIRLYVLLNLVNNITERDYFSNFIELLKNLISWNIKGLIAIVVGISAIKSMLAPATDSLTATALQRGLSIIPGGQAVNTVSGVMIGAGVLIKNAIGVGGMLVLCIAICIPVIKMATFIIIYRMMAATIQPIADVRMIRGINGISQGGQLLVSTVLMITAMFMVSIAIIAVSTNVTYYAG